MQRNGELCKEVANVADFLSTGHRSSDVQSVQSSCALAHDAAFIRLAVASEAARNTARPVSTRYTVLPRTQVHSP